MKKIITISIILILLITTIFINYKNNTKENNLKKVKIAEVAHSIFYTPQYLADIGFCGTEATIYVAN